VSAGVVLKQMRAFGASAWTRLRTVYMSGYHEYNRGNDDFLEDGFFLQKPFSRDTLVLKVGEALRTGSRSRT